MHVHIVPLYSGSFGVGGNGLGYPAIKHCHHDRYGTYRGRAQAETTRASVKLRRFKWQACWCPANRATFAAGADVRAFSEAEGLPIADPIRRIRSSGCPTPGSEACAPGSESCGLYYSIVRIL